MIAARVAGQADLTDVRTRRLSASLDAPPVSGHRLGYDFHTDLKHGRAGDVFFVEATYTLKTFQRQDEEDPVEKGEQFALIEFELLAIYDLPAPSEDDYSSEEFSAFTNTTAQFALYPFAREMAHELTHRLGIPPLTLGIMRLPLDADEIVVAPNHQSTS